MVDGERKKRRRSAACKNRFWKSAKSEKKKKITFKVFPFGHYALAKRGGKWNGFRLSIVLPQPLIHDTYKRATDFPDFTACDKLTNCPL